MFKMKEINALLLERADLLTELEKYNHDFKLKTKSLFEEICLIDEKLTSLTYQALPIERHKKECVECMRTVRYNFNTQKLEIDWKEYITWH